ncbi:MAG: Bax inhibitor-1/YccA family protein [Mycobacteriales bacterium]
MRSSNPVLARLTERAGRHAGLRREPVLQEQGAGGGGYAGFGEPGVRSDTQTYAPYGQTEQQPMTLDDVVVRTVALLGITGITAALAWLLLPDSAAITGIALLGSVLIGLGLGLVISFKQITNPYVIGGYAVVEGVLVGVVSKFYAEQFDSGIILQAVVGTFGVFFAMAALYKLKILRATPTFVKWVTGALFGFIALAVLNLGLGLFGVNDGAGLGLRDGSTMAILFSLFAIGLAAMTFILDFGMIEQGVAAGVERRYAWYCAFGILVGLVWLYLEILRLLGYTRD